MRRRAWELGASAIEHQLQLFDIFVQPVLSYGCEVWGVDLLGQPASASERVHRWFCRRLLGLPQSASSAIVLAELGRWPLHVHWVQQITRFWNRMLETEGDCLAVWAFQDNLELMREQMRRQGPGQAVPSPCWCLRWFRFLQAAPTDTGTLVWLTELDEKAMVERAKAAYVRAAAGGQGPATSPSGDNSSGSVRTPRFGSSSGQLAGAPTVPEGTPLSQACTAGAGRPGGRSGRCGRLTDTLGPFTPRVDGSYVTRVCCPYPEGCHRNKFALYLDNVRGDTPLGLLAPHLHLGAVKDWRHRDCLTRFRCSCHDLRVERDRYLPVEIKPPRHLRTCRLCASHDVEGEQHMVFTCPLYEPIRFKFANLFTSDCQDLNTFLSNDLDDVAMFIYSCFELRSTATQMSLAGS